MRRGAYLIDTVDGERDGAGIHVHDDAYNVTRRVRVGILDERGEPGALARGARLGNAAWRWLTRRRTFFPELEKPHELGAAPTFLLVASNWALSTTPTHNPPVGAFWAMTNLNSCLPDVIPPWARTTLPQEVMDTDSWSSLITTLLHARGGVSVDGCYGMHSTAPSHAPLVLHPGAESHDRFAHCTRRRGRRWHQCHLMHEARPVHTHDTGVVRRGTHTGPACGHGERTWRRQHSKQA